MLVVRVGGQRYAVPQADVQEVVSVAVEDRANKVHRVGGSAMLSLRGRLLPLIDLVVQFTATEWPADREATIVVVKATDRCFGMIVDHVDDTTDVVVKPLTRAVRTIRVFSGVTILADGMAALIVDVVGLAVALDITAAAVHTGPAPAAPAAPSPQQLLIASIDGRRVAVELSSVRRLEQVPWSRIERVGAWDMASLRRRILPIVGSAATDGGLAERTGEMMLTVVCDTSSGPVGLAVTRIDDIVDLPERGARSSRAGAAG